MFPTSFDELNQLVGYKRSMEFEEYFGDMHISDEQKQQRIALAEQLESEFAYMVALLFYERGMLTAALAYELRDRYLKVLTDNGLLNQDAVNRANEIINGRIYDSSFDADIIRHANEFSVGILLVTMNHEDDPYFFSLDRARLMAESESGTFWNMEEYEEALEIGYAFKTWCTAGDNHVRDTHAEMEGMTLPVYEPFELAGGLMQMPRDTSLGADDSEVAGCRCTLDYSNEE